MGVNKKIKDLFKFLPKAKHKAGEGLEKGTYPFYTSSAVVNKYFDEYDYEPNKLIFATGGSASVHYADSKFAVSTDNFILEPNEDVNAKYVYYYLKNNLQIIQDGFHGAGLQHLSKDYLNEVSVPMLDNASQDKVVSILDKADEIRAKKKLANNKLDEFLKSTYIDLFAENTKKVKLEELCYFITKGTTPKAQDMSQDSGDIPYIKVYNLRFDTRLDFTINPTFVTKESHKNFLARSVVYPGDVLMNIVGPPLCKVSIVPDTYPEWNINQAIARFRCNKGLNNLYLAWFLTTPFAEKQMLRNAKKTSGQLNLTLEICKNIEIPLPSLDLQNKFARIVEKVEAQKQKNELVIEQMNNLFNSLSQRAFKGELAQSDSVDLITKQTVLHAKIIDKCNSHQTFGAVKMEKIFNLCDMSQELNLVPGGYYRKAAGPYVPEMRHSVEEKLAQNNWVKTINKGNGKKVEFKKDTKFAEYKNLYSEIFKDYEEQINKIIDYFYDKDTDYCEAFSTLYMCWNDLILEGKNPSKFEIIDEFKNHWAPEKQRFERIYLLEILSDMSNNHFEPHGQGLHTIDSEYNVNKDQLNLQLN